MIICIKAGGRVGNTRGDRVRGRGHKRCIRRGCCGDSVKGKGSVSECVGWNEVSEEEWVDGKGGKEEREEKITRCTLMTPQCLPQVRRRQVLRD